MEEKRREERFRASTAVFMIIAIIISLIPAGFYFTGNSSVNDNEVLYASGVETLDQSQAVNLKEENNEENSFGDDSSIARVIDDSGEEYPDVNVHAIVTPGN